MMQEWDARYPGYGLAHNMGYGSADHRDALRRLGPSAIHRRSFHGTDQALARSDGDPRASRQALAKINPVKVKQDADKLEKAGKLDQAIALYRQLVDDNPRDWNTIKKIGDLYARLNRRRGRRSTSTRRSPTSTRRTAST